MILHFIGRNSTLKVEILPKNRIYRLEKDTLARFDYKIK
jgi:hypothetical protein